MAKAAPQQHPLTQALAEQLLEPDTALAVVSGPDYDVTVAEIAGVIAGGLLTPRDFTPGMLEDTPRCELLAKGFVNLARAIVAETKRTEPKDAQ